MAAVIVENAQQVCARLAAAETRIDRFDRLLVVNLVLGHCLRDQLAQLTLVLVRARHTIVVRILPFGEKFVQYHQPRYLQTQLRLVQMLAQRLERFGHAQIDLLVVRMRLDDTVLLQLQPSGAKETDRATEHKRNIQVPEQRRQVHQHLLLDVARNDNGKVLEEIRIHFEQRFNVFVHEIAAHIWIELLQQLHRALGPRLAHIGRVQEETK